METRYPEKYKEYTRRRNKVRAMTHKLRRNLEKDISRQAKLKPRQFWNYVKGKMKTRTGVSDLIIQSDGNEEILTKTNLVKA